MDERYTGGRTMPGSEQAEQQERDLSLRAAGDLAKHMLQRGTGPSTRGPGNAAALPAKPAPLADILQQLEGEISTNQQLTELLSHRLDPVLVPAVPMSAEDPGASNTAGPLGDVLRTLSARVHHTNRQIDSLLSRLAL